VLQRINAARAERAWSGRGARVGPILTTITGTSGFLIVLKIGEHRFAVVDGVDMASSAAVLGLPSRTASVLEKPRRSNRTKTGNAALCHSENKHSLQFFSRIPCGIFATFMPLLNASSLK
jgi:hypothetical protein